MLSLLSIIGIVLAAYLLNQYLRLAINYKRARSIGIPVVVLPYDSEAVPTLIFGAVFYETLRDYLPEAVYDHIAPGLPQTWENEFKRKLFVKFKSRSFAVVTTRSVIIHTCDAEVVVDEHKRILDFRQSVQTKEYLDIFGSNVASSDGPSWAKQRKLLTSIINERVSKTIFDESHRQTNYLIEDIRAAQVDGHSSGTMAIHGVRRIAINVLSKAGYGQEQSWQESKLNDDFDVDAKIDFITSVKACIENLILANSLPASVMINWPSWLPGHRTVRQIGVGKREYPLLAKARIDEERATQASNDSAFSQQSLLGQLVRNSGQTGANPSEKDTKHEPLGLSESEMHGNLFLFTIAGYDTTASVLQFALVLLAAFPDVQEWLIEEADRLFPASVRDQGNVDYASIYPKAHRHQALMLEILRLIPPVPHNSRQAAISTTIRTSTQTLYIPAGTIIHASAPAIQTDPSIWRHLNSTTNPGPSPSTTTETLEDATAMTQDEYLFRPSRWLNPDPHSSSGPLYKPAPGTFQAWSTGPRVCPGMKMSQVEFVGVMMTLLSEFRIEGVPRGICGRGSGRRKTETQHDLQARYWGITRDALQRLTQQMKRVEEVDLRWVPRRAA